MTEKHMPALFQPLFSHLFRMELVWGMRLRGQYKRPNHLGFLMSQGCWAETLEGWTLPGFLRTGVTALGRQGSTCAGLD